jgi:anthranilate phosphoribosyltransferase|tara:strand:- start:3697 stop:4719 length:1023 start_codon:yes stop_codon:yes gene_type:complete
VDLKEALAHLVEGRDLEQEQARATFHLVMSGEASPTQIAALLTALRMKGETAAELAGATQAMRTLSTKVEVDAPHLVDTCGTGGSGIKLFNISTAAAFVVAAAGASVAKHGNRKMTSFSGSADVLEAAGVNIQLTPDQIAHCIREVGVGFLFAQAHHRAMRHAASVRQEIGFRTMMNVLGPMTNPAGTKRQVLGVFSADWQRTMAEVLQRLGSEHVMVVHSRGLDELSLDGPSSVVELQLGQIEHYELVPEDVGLTTTPVDELRATDADTSLNLMKQALTRPNSPAAEIVALNAGAAIYVSGVATSLANGVMMAQDAIASGLAEERLKELARVSALMAEA